ncbi:Putative ABC-transporter type IV [Desulfotomaculum arcticum]|uniref:Putative ABC-transporter type IV n=1 Tax=Desulfotruncus arcticus DSM 17038 TaxID=1121424 RepID=A0A1I2TNG0_9FIRM|nr:hypothetical protein [Desulfotruncus arcticus]SFG66418.1 Putative ABC-transporter type IV [Desulfotomaculum arcticum] [Desulfotruncus arcticus DSM 17038]
MLTRFVIYGLLGWNMEVFWTGLMSGLNGNPRLAAHTYLWMFPIYGLAVLLEPLHEKIRFLPWYLRGMIWVLVIWAVEFTTGGLLRMIVGTSPWIYREGWQIYGLIRLDMAPLWFAAGLLFERIHDRLTKSGLPIGNK